MALHEEIESYMSSAIWDMLLSRAIPALTLHAIRTRDYKDWVAPTEDEEEKKVYEKNDAFCYREL